MDYTFASRTTCTTSAIVAKPVTVVGGGTLDTSATINTTTYYNQQEAFSGEFMLLQLKGYDLIFYCDWIKRHSPIGIDLRVNSSNLTIMKDVQRKVTFKDFTAPTSMSPINAAKLEKICRSDNLGYIIQVNLIQHS
jgi:hypothetical protein